MSETKAEDIQLLASLYKVFPVEGTSQKRLEAARDFKRFIEACSKRLDIEGPSKDSKKLYDYLEDIARYGDPPGGTAHTIAAMCFLIDLFVSVKNDFDAYDTQQNYEEALQELRLKHPLRISKENYTIPPPTGV